MLKAIILHWTAGGYFPNTIDLRAYHFLVDKNGKTYNGFYIPKDNENCTDGNYAAHTGGGNTGRIGIAICCRKDLKTPPTQKQVEAMCKLAAQCCIKYGILPQNVQTHAEFGLEHPKTSSAGKIDINSLPYANLSGIKTCGDYLRNKVNWYYLKEKNGK